VRADDNPFYGHPDAYPITRWRAKGARATDGDTGIVLIERGPAEFGVLEYRLSTIDAYELHKGPEAWLVLGEQARQFADDRIRGRWLRILSVLDTEKYGRTLMAVEYQTRAGNWLDLAEQLRANGFEKPRILATRHAEISRAHRILTAARARLGP
jgi:endonuclease YncB( thermonuclease family)